MLSNNINIGIEEASVSQALFILQLSSVGVQVLSQLTIIITVTQLVKDKIINTFFLDAKLKKYKQKLLMKKYGNRWLYLVHRRTIKGFPPPPKRLKTFKTFH